MSGSKKVKLDEVIGSLVDAEGNTTTVIVFVNPETGVPDHFEKVYKQRYWLN